MLSQGRRDFLKVSAAAGGGVVIGFRLSSLEAAAAATHVFAPNAFIRISPTNKITFIVGRTEMGQGVFTSLAMLLAEELEVDIRRVRVDSAPADPAYDHPSFRMQMTGGSLSVMSSWEPRRRAGATAREMLIRAAANNWRVGPETCRAENGSVVHVPTSRRITYGELAHKASGLPVPETVSLKEPATWKVIGKAVSRLDGEAIIDGRTKYGIDVVVPGMLTALVARPPAFGAVLKSFDARKTNVVPGVQKVIPIDGGVAVVAQGFWSAKKGLDALEVEWSDGPLSSTTGETQRANYRTLAGTPGRVAKEIGDIEAARKTAAKVIDAVFEVPYLAHAMMEPLNCVADVKPDSCEIWTGTQYQKLDREAAARLTDLPLDRVKLHAMQCGTGFGRRWAVESHFIKDAVQLSKVMKTPIKVIWSREDDIRGGWYRPRYYHSISACADAIGNPIA